MRPQSNDQCNTSFIYLHVCLCFSVAVPQRAVAHRPPVLRHRAGTHQRGRRLRLAHRRAHERPAVSVHGAQSGALCRGGDGTLHSASPLCPCRPGDESVSVTDLLDLSSVSLPSSGSSPPPLVPCGLASPPSSASLRGSSPPPPSASSQPVDVSSSSGHRLSSEPPDPSPPSSTLSSLPSTTPTSASASAPPSAAASFVSLSPRVIANENDVVGLISGQF